MKTTKTVSLEQDLIKYIMDTVQAGGFSARLEELLRKGIEQEQDDSVNLDTAMKYVKRAGIVIQKLQQAGTDS